MKDLTFRKWHRNVAIALMPLIVIQIISGFVLSIVDAFGFVQRTPQGSPEGIAFLVIRKLPKFMSSYDELMMALHFLGGSLFGNILRTLTAIVLVWVMISGTYIFFSIRARNKKVGK